jgi:hypothetical protein
MLLGIKQRAEQANEQMPEPVEGTSHEESRLDEPVTLSTQGG